MASYPPRPPGSGNDLDPEPLPLHLPLPLPSPSPGQWIDQWRREGDDDDDGQRRPDGDQPGRVIEIDLA
jgi:hypothetical protein